MKKGKKVISLVLSCALVVSMFTGCGSKKNNNNNTAEKTTTEATTEAKEDAADTATTETSGEKTKLRWAVWDIAATTYYQPLIDAYVAKNPNVEIEMVDLGSQDYMTALATQLAGNDTNLDVVCVKDIPGYTNLVSKNVLEPVDTTNLDLTQYGGITDQIKINDQIYALPFRSDFWVLFYNKDIFDAAGVDYPTNDMTFEQYDELARKVTKTDLGSEVYGAHYHTWRSAVQLFGILDGKNSIIGGNYDFLKSYYEMVLNEQKDGVCQDYATLKTSSLHYSGAFAQGNVAMMNMGSWFIPTLIEKIKSGEYTDIKNWGIVKYPHAEGVEPGSTLATITSLAVTSASKNKEVATDFMNFVCGAEGADVIAATGTFPAIKTDSVVSAIASMEGFPTDAESAEALKTANTYLEMPVSDKSAEIETILNDGHDYIMTETMTIDEGIAYMNEEVGKILK
ncbi:extracellular solute-binding protein [Anaerosporobacter faecicola]|uniref:extracellular solute-binding protein n=1 Tax=Anaerosporobacter faecicola TaxID=2718714 RepID=UPI00143B2D24|nr:extracellular solute-binding protein [Anaerosporobacter faecicola]